MANSSQMEQEIRNVFKTKLNTELDIDLSQQCMQAAEASQSIKNIQLKGVKDVSLNQKNFVENRCVLNSILNLDMMDQLSADVQSELLSKLEQKSPIIPSINASSQRQKVENIIETEIGLQAKLDLSKKCLQQLTANQSIENIKIKDSLNIDLTQDAVNYNKCFMDGAVDITKGTDIDLKTDTKAKTDTKQTGGLAGLLGGLLSMPLMSLIAPVVICVLLSSASLAMGALAPKGSKKEEPKPDEDADVEKAAEELTSGTNAATNAASAVKTGEKLADSKTGRKIIQGASEALKKAFGSRKGTKQQGGGGLLGQVGLLLSPQYRIFIVILLVAFVLMAMFGKHQSTSPEIKQLEKMANTPVSRLGTGGNYNFHPAHYHGYPSECHTHTQHKKKPYPVYDPMYF